MIAKYDVLPLKLKAHVLSLLSVGDFQGAKQACEKWLSENPEQNSKVDMVAEEQVVYS
jgi:hypothetical protein